jgi:hypothetical protein
MEAVARGMTCAYENTVGLLFHDHDSKYVHVKLMMIIATASRK